MTVYEEGALSAVSWFFQALTHYYSLSPSIHSLEAVKQAQRAKTAF
jgi:hypothetical protein